MNLSKYFYLKFAGLFGLCYSIILFVTFVTRQIMYSTLNQNFSINWMMEIDFILYLFLISLFVIGSIILFILGTSGEKNNLIDNENYNTLLVYQLTGIVLLVLGMISLESIFLQIWNYIKYSHDEYLTQRFQMEIFISIFSTFLKLILGTIFLSIKKILSKQK